MGTYTYVYIHIYICEVMSVCVLVFLFCVVCPACRCRTSASALRWPMLRQNDLKTAKAIKVSRRSRGQCCAQKGIKHAKALTSVSALKRSMLRPEKFEKREGAHKCLG